MTRAERSLENLFDLKGLSQGHELVSHVGGVKLDSFLRSNLEESWSNFPNLASEKLDRLFLDELSVYSMFKRRIRDYHLYGYLSDFGASEFLNGSNNQRVSFLETNHPLLQRAFIVSADYQTDIENMGRVFGVVNFCAEISGKDRKELKPILKFSRYIQMPSGLVETLNRGSRFMLAGLNRQFTDGFK